MMADDIKQRIQRYRELANIHSHMDYGNLESVRVANFAANDMRTIAQEIGMLNRPSINRE